MLFENQQTKRGRIYLPLVKGSDTLESFDGYPPILTVADVQEILGVGRSLAYRMINDEKIKSVRVGKNIRIPKLYLLEFILGEEYNDYITSGELPVH